MATKLDEISDGIFRISTFVPAINPPVGFTFNQFLVKAEQPFLFHCGHRKMFPQIAEAVSRVLPVAELRWIGFSHVEADECGALENWLEAAPGATVVHGAVGCRIWVSDLTDRLRALRDNETLDLGGKRVRHLDTPHLPHGWDAGLLFEETSATLFCSDLFAHGGDGPAVTSDDVVATAIEGEDRSQSMSLTPATAPMLRRLAALAPRTLAVMHGSSYAGKPAAALGALADHAERKLKSLSS
ncbi:MAG TPA: MBL fold metallo-hydrolase [Stellaceae bacterium]|jgi:flavorubredoxin|nr:MBL fold metallo-hydrolase [Stellaceae bacterium]